MLFRLQGLVVARTVVPYSRLVFQLRGAPFGEKVENTKEAATFCALPTLPVPLRAHRKPLSKLYDNMFVPAALFVSLDER